MTWAGSSILRAAAIAALFAAVPGAAFAAEAPVSITGNAWVAIGIIVVVVALVWFLISGTLGITARDKADDDEAGVGVLEGIDEDDDKPRKKGQR